MIWLLLIICFLLVVLAMDAVWLEYGEFGVPFWVWAWLLVGCLFGWVVWLLDLLCWFVVCFRCACILVTVWFCCLYCSNLCLACFDFVVFWVVLTSVLIDFALFDFWFYDCFLVWCFSWSVGLLDCVAWLYFEFGFIVF